MGDEKESTNVRREFEKDTDSDDNRTDSSAAGTSSPRFPAITRRHVNTKLKVAAKINNSCMKGFGPLPRITDPSGQVSDPAAKVDTAVKVAATMASCLAGFAPIPPLPVPISLPNLSVEAEFSRNESETNSEPIGIPNKQFPAPETTSDPSFAGISSAQGPAIVSQRISDTKVEVKANIPVSLIGSVPLPDGESFSGKVAVNRKVTDTISVPVDKLALEVGQTMLFYYGTDTCNRFMNRIKNLPNDVERARKMTEFLE
ncbi:uncharacterized protein LOC135841306 [Planococcus citri]|uniref:uncharacterized protein LOC135841306 n=1 Tax=Planococcus citri TaxID=170843 RepID=UPI0031F8C296